MGMENLESFTPEVLSPEHVRVLIPHNPELAHYNAAVLRSKKSPNKLLLMVREVPMESVRAGFPDKGRLIYFLSTPEEVRRMAQLDLDRDDLSHLEDPRAFCSEESFTGEGGVEYQKVAIGLTAIDAINNRPVVATVRGRLMDDDFQLEPESFVVYKDDEGKNVTFVSLEQFFIRRNGELHTHELELVKNAQDGDGKNILKTIQTIQFPKKWWCEWGMGTQAQMLEDGILPIHGVNRTSLGFNPDTGEEVFEHTYSLGLAQLDADKKVIRVSERPLFTRKSFEKILSMDKEMDPTKHVVYCCGYSVDDDIVRFVVNIGDLMTVEVAKKMSELRALLAEDPAPIILEKVPAGVS